MNKGYIYMVEVWLISDIDGRKINDKKGGKNNGIIK